MLVRSIGPTTPRFASLGHLGRGAMFIVREAFRSFSPLRGAEINVDFVNRVYLRSS